MEPLPDVLLAHSTPDSARTIPSSNELSHLLATLRSLSTAALTRRTEFEADLAILKPKDAVADGPRKAAAKYKRAGTTRSARSESEEDGGESLQKKRKRKATTEEENIQSESPASVVTNSTIAAAAPSSIHQMSPPLPTKPTSTPITNTTTTAAAATDPDQAIATAPSPIRFIRPPPSALTLREEQSLEEVRAMTDIEEKKKILAVHSFPTQDLSYRLPGPPPTEDFSRAKPTNQIAMSTFMTSIEPHFRHFTEEDLSFLREKGDSLAPYLIPAIGDSRQHHANHDHEDGAGDGENGSNSFGSKPLKGPEDLTDEVLETEEVSCGPLAERMLSALVQEDIIEANSEEAKDGATATTNGTNQAPPTANAQQWRINSVKADYAMFEERLKRELRYIGLLDEGEEVNWSARQDDEISSTLRNLQKQLRKQSRVNASYKNRVEQKVIDQMAWQEYSTILDDLDKQVEQAYLKRTRTIKAKKKRVVGGAGSGGGSSSGWTQPPAHTNSTSAANNNNSSYPLTAGESSSKPGVSDATRAIRERRRRWITKLRPVFEPHDQYLRIPTESIFEGIDEDAGDNDDLDNEEDDVLDEGIDISSVKE